MIRSVTASLYSSKVLNNLPGAAQDGPVAALCRRSDTTWAPLVADLIDSWCRTLEPSKKTLVDLVSPDASTFWSAYWEVTVGKAFQVMDFDVNMKANVGGLTPDMMVSRSGWRSMVEVFAVLDDHATVQEQNRLRRVARRMQEDASLPGPGLLSLSAIGHVLEDPSEETLSALVAAVDDWAESRLDEQFDFTAGNLTLVGFWMAAEAGTTVAVTETAQALNSAPRVQARLGEKIKRYGPATGPDLDLMLAVGINTWKLTRHGVLVALHGQEQVTIDLDDPDSATATFSGDGAAVVGGVHGYDEAKHLAGTWAMSRTYDDERQALVLDAAFIHNPYALRPLLADTFAPLPEMQVSGTSLTWVRQTDQRLLLTI